MAVETVRQVVVPPTPKWPARVGHEQGDRTWPPCFSSFSARRDGSCRYRHEADRSRVGRGRPRPRPAARRDSTPGRGSRRSRRPSRRWRRAARSRCQAQISLGIAVVDRRTAGGGDGRLTPQELEGVAERLVDDPSLLCEGGADEEARRASSRRATTSSSRNRPAEGVVRGGAFDAHRVLDLVDVDDAQQGSLRGTPHRHPMDERRGLRAHFDPGHTGHFNFKCGMDTFHALCWPRSPGTVGGGRRRRPGA